MSKREILAEGKYLRLINENRWEFAERVTGTGVVIIVAAIEGRLILTEQYRASVAKNVIELPAGLVGDIAGEESESLELAAKRELMEETGYSAKQMTLLSEGPPSSGISNEIVSFYLAEGLTKVAEGGGDETENITVHEVPLLEVEQWAEKQVKAGALIDPKVFSGIYFALRNTLFSRKS